MATTTKYPEKQQSEPFDLKGIYRYGSNTSTDIDLFIAIDRIPENNREDRQNIEELREMVKYVILDSMKVNDKRIDYSFIHVSDDGVIDWCEYDDLEECNNALYYTFDHHVYNNAVVRVNPVKRKLTQNVSFKIVKVVRQLLTLLSRTEYRDDVKYLLKNGTFKQRLEFVIRMVSEQKFSKIQTFNKNLDDVEILKDIAFSFIQLYSLIEDVDVFCKKDACLRFPDLAPFILREDDAKLETLEEFIIETFQKLSANIEVYDHIDAVKFTRDQYGCLNKEERIITDKRLD